MTHRRRSGPATHVTPVSLEGSADFGDAFHRLRVSQPVSLFEASHIYSAEPLIWVEKATSGGTSAHRPNESSVRLAVDATEDASIIRQSCAYLHYQPGRSHHITMTGTMQAPVTGITKRWGLYDNNNGIYLEQAGDGTISLVRRSNFTGTPVEERVPQTSWNWQQLLGNHNEHTLDPTKSWIFGIALQWLGVGTATCFFDIDRRIEIAHEFHHANEAAGVYMSMASLPVRYEIVADGVTAGGALDMICSEVHSQGGDFDPHAFSFAGGNQTTGRSVTSATAVPLVAIRHATDFNSIENRMQSFVDSARIFMTSSGNIHYEILYNPVIVGGSWAAVNSESGMEINVTGTSATGGIDIDEGWIGGAKGERTEVGALLNRMPMGLDVDGENPTVIAITAQALAGGTETVYGSMRWREVR
jgi:hypothetical protein